MLVGAPAAALPCRTMVARLPAPLALLLVVTLIEALAWTFANPPLQNADEAGHIAYVQKIADGHAIPWGRKTTTSREDPRQLSTELRTAALWSGLEPLRANRAARPRWPAGAGGLGGRRDDRCPARGGGEGGPATTSGNPPLYYVYAAIPWASLDWASTFGRQELVRLANIPFLLLTVALTWLLAAQLFGGRRWLCTVAAGAVALQPLFISIATGVTPDALLTAEWALGLELALLVVVRGPSRRLVAGLVATCAAAALTQGRGLPLAAVAAVALGVALWRDPR